MKRTFALALSALLALAATASAGPVLVNQDPGTPNTTVAITGSATTGADMVGMLVTAFFNNGSSQALAWGATGPTAGGVTGTGWSLSVSGDTFGATWTLANTSAGGGSGIARVVLNGGPGKTVFDRTFSGFGTDGSFSGRDFTETSGTTFPITATYRNTVALIGTPPVRWGSVQHPRHPVHRGRWVALRRTDRVHR